jgi:calcineurin-like phosphoesterase family protein
MANDSPKDFVTSDLHLLHRLMMEKRGFATVEEHDETIIANWNKTVRPADRVRLLGDVSLAAPEEFWPLVDRLNGEIHLITGNHDAAAAQHLHAHRHQREWMDHFASVLPYARIRAEGQHVLLSHYPYAGDSESAARPDGKDRYPEYRLRDEGLTLVHGHVHSKTQVTFSPRGSLQIHVGLDAHNLTPVPLGWVQKVIREEGNVA